MKSSPPSSSSTISYDDGSFRSLTDHPSENTLTVNVTHQQLNRLDPPFKRLVAIAPSRYDEGAGTSKQDPKGYDVKLETAKQIVFQHKAPDNAVVRNGKQWLNYKVNMDQLQVLFHRYRPKEAFYALPAIPQHKHIRDGLNRTVFVDIWPIYIKHLESDEEISRIYVEYCPDETDIPEVKGKFKTRERQMGGYPYWDIRTSHDIYGDAMKWQPIEDRLKGCTFGLPIRGIEIEDYPFSQVEENLPGFQEEPLENLHPVYREHVKHQFALDQYVSKMEEKDQVFEWIISSLQNRLETAWQRDWHIGHYDFNISTERSIERLRADLDTLAGSRYDPTHHIAGAQRCILEKGESSSTITI